MKQKLAFIIAFLFLMIFSSKEIFAQAIVSKAVNTEFCDHQDCRHAEQGAEERGSEEESKLLFHMIEAPTLLPVYVIKIFAYHAPFIPNIYTGIVVPPPKKV